MIKKEKRKRKKKLHLVQDEKDVARWMNAYSDGRRGVELHGQSAHEGCWSIASSVLSRFVSLLDTGTP